jgi:hypothetical protein
MLFSNAPRSQPTHREGSTPPASGQAAPTRSAGHLRVALLLACVAALSGCGGGGSAAPTPAPTPIPAPPAVVDPLAPLAAVDLTNTGVDAAGVGGDSAGDGGADGSAGDGAPLKKAVVTLTDSKGNFVNGLTDNNGKFLLKYKTSVFTAPLVLRVIGVGGSVLSSVTDEVALSGKSIRANINPLTDKITSDVLPVGVAGTDKLFDGSKVDITKLAKAKADLVASVKTALGSAGIADTSRFDPIKSAYNYDGTGVDAIIESISHARDPVTGATQLSAKLGGVQNNADGTVVPALITASTPLATTQVALSSNPALAFDKLNVWINHINSCLAIGAAQTADCDDADGTRYISNGYKHNSKNLLADFNTLLSESDGTHVPGSTFRNPSILFFARSTGSSIVDRAVVEVTINQPRIGPLAGSLGTPVEYTKVLVFKRDDSLTRAKAGNWILFGNQRNFDWSVDANYISQTQTNLAKQANTAGNSPSWMRSGIRMNFSNLVYNTATTSFTPANVYAVRLKGPGLPANGIVYAPTSIGTNPAYTILNKTGIIPAQGTLSPNVQRDFRMSGALLGTGGALDPAVWPGTAAHSADTLTSTDLSALQAYSRYQAEIYINGSSAPIVETASILAPVQSAATMAKIPLHDLSTSNNLSYLTPPFTATNSVTVDWKRIPGAARIDGAYALFFSGALNNTNIGANVVDSLALVPTSTSVTISSGAVSFPASAITDFRELGINGRSARANFTNSVIRTP